MITVKCQNCRSKSITDNNGSRRFQKNAVCMRLLGRMADIDAVAMERNIGGILGNFRMDKLNLATAQKLLVDLFCKTFVASFYCAGCQAFMDVRYTAPGYEVEATPRDEAGYGKVMQPKVKTRQVEIA